MLTSILEKNRQIFAKFSNVPNKIMLLKSSRNSIIVNNFVKGVRSIALVKEGASLSFLWLPGGIS